MWDLHPKLIARTLRGEAAWCDDITTPARETCAAYFPFKQEIRPGVASTSGGLRRLQDRAYGALRFRKMSRQRQKTRQVGGACQQFQHTRARGLRIEGRRQAES